MYEINEGLVRCVHKYTYAEKQQQNAKRKTRFLSRAKRIPPKKVLVIYTRDRREFVHVKLNSRAKFKLCVCIYFLDKSLQLHNSCIKAINYI